VNRAKRKGEGVLISKPRGGRKKRLISSNHERKILNLVREKYPEQLKLPFVLWTRECVQALIKDVTGVKPAIRTVGTYLERWRFTPQKPLKKAYEQDPLAAQEWVETIYPTIREKATAEDGIIYWEDEMGLRSQHYAGRSYSPKGETPVIQLSGKRFGVNMISAITNSGKLAFSLYEERFTQVVFINFLKRLISHANGRKVFVIVDGHPVHRGKKVQAWLDENKLNIEMFFMPGYSPDLNPDELLNQEIKATVFSKKRPREKKELKTLLESKLYSIQRQPEKITSYFKAKYTQYAMA
jgi:transposase